MYKVFNGKIEEEKFVQLGINNVYMLYDQTMGLIMLVFAGIDRGISFHVHPDSAFFDWCCGSFPPIFRAVRWGSVIWRMQAGNASGDLVIYVGF